MDNLLLSRPDVAVYNFIFVSFDSEVLIQMKKFPPELAAKYMYQLASAMDYCQQKKVLHRDLKPENVLISSNGDLKISDFGWSVHEPSSKFVCFPC